LIPRGPHSRSNRTSQSFCNYSAYGETGDDPLNDPIYPDPYPGGYKGLLSSLPH